MESTHTRATAGTYRSLSWRSRVRKTSYEGQVIERFPSFREYFLAMLDYYREEIRHLEQRRS